MRPNPLIHTLYKKFGTDALHDATTEEKSRRLMLPVLHHQQTSKGFYISAGLKLDPNSAMFTIRDNFIDCLRTLYR
jgi:hypothetical protein